MTDRRHSGWSKQDKWLLGAQTRDRVGVISDIWRGTGAALAAQNLIVVIPQLGWWKYYKMFPDPDNAPPAPPFVTR